MTFDSKKVTVNNEFMELMDAILICSLEGNEEEMMFITKIHRIGRILTLLLLIVIPAVSIASSVGTVSCSSLNLRSQANKQSKSLQTLQQGDHVTILSTDGDWYKVNYGKYTGYVMKKYISEGTVSSSSAASAQTAATPTADLLAALKKIGKPTPCTFKSQGSNVKKLQKCLAAYGYYTGNIDGDYGVGTRDAVKKLQKAKKLKQTGDADSATIAAMFEEKSSTGTEMLNWFHGGKDQIARGQTFTVKDCLTGKSFQCKRWAGSNHLDAEPLTKKDTATIKEIYGSWSWNRRAILVKYDGKVYAASMNGMPHGTSTISDNEFAGHFCIHFYGSKTHGTKKVDSNHQKCVATALDYAW